MNTTISDRVRISGKIHTAKTSGKFGDVRDENGRFVEASCGTRGTRTRAHYVAPGTAVTCSKCRSVS